MGLFALRKHEDESRRSRSARLHLSALLGPAGALISVLMILCFPLRSAHDFNQHFRTTRIRRSVISHTFVSVAKEAPAKAASRAVVKPVSFIVINLASETESLAGIVSLPVLPPRILLLFRLGPTRTSGEDPFI
jgi:hypothetical protein